MRSLTETLLAEQKRATRKPVIKVEVQAYGHPSQSASLQWELFGWQRLYQGSETQNYHDCCIDGNGNLHRIRLEGTTIYYSRVTSPGPGSTFSSWTNFGTTLADSDIAIAAQGASVMMVSCNASNLYRRESSDYGDTWGSWTQFANARPCERGAAVAFKPNGDCLIVHASDVNDPNSLYIQKRITGSWSTGLGQRSGDWAIEGLAAYYDGDWNIAALVIEGSFMVLYRMVCGDGDRVTAGTWTTDLKIGLARTKLSFSAQMQLRQFKSQRMFGGEACRTPTWWEKHQTVIEALAGEGLDVAGVSITKPASSPALLTTARSLAPWLFRMKPGTDFYDNLWNKASFIQNCLSNYGMALACDSSYIWATQANEVWRSALPAFWAAPGAGSGAGSSVTLPAPRILAVNEEIKPHQESTLTVELDNSKGTFDSPGSGDCALIKRGARVNLSIGYKTSAGDDLEEVGQYFIESYEHNREAGRATFALNCIDAWGLLERYQFNKPLEWNVGSEDYTVYGLIELVLSSIGASLDYKSRSILVTSMYPQLDVHAGESAASVLRRLLDLVPDVIYFYGLTGYIVYPQATDLAVYHYQFPK